MERNHHVSIFSLFILLLSLSSMATATVFDHRRDWQKIKIPGAKCGSGADYHVFFSKGRSEKLALDFMGGGLCWSKRTCYGPTPTTWVHPLPAVLESGGFVSLNPQISPVNDYSIVYFPYCTGDLHLGRNIVEYGKSRVFHYGSSNVQRTISYLTNQRIVQWPWLTDFVVYGYSAGALGAIYHANWIDQYIPQNARKTLIADAPGLHWGKEYLQRFRPQYKRDVTAALQTLGIRNYSNNGHVARIIPTFCRRHPEWTVMALQASKDPFMSSIFGETTQEEHRAAVYSEEGLVELTKDPTDKCISFVPDSSRHTFYAYEFLLNISASGKKARDFIFDAFYGVDFKNYVDFPY